MISDADKKELLTLFKPPFVFDERGDYIFDSDTNMVLDNTEELAVARLRGWGRIQYLEDANNLQNKVGELIALALTEYWENHSK